MVCIYCSQKTRVTNSRPQKRLLQVWRRRQCTVCGALFTTNEIVDLSTSLVVRHGSGTIKPFTRDKLYLSIVRSVGHRPTAINDATSLCATITAQLVHEARTASVTPEEIIAKSVAVLKRFDAAAAVQYQAYHKT